MPSPGSPSPAQSSSTNRKVRSRMLGKSGSNTQRTSRSADLLNAPHHVLKPDRLSGYDTLLGLSSDKRCLTSGGSGVIERHALRQTPVMTNIAPASSSTEEEVNPPSATLDSMEYRTLDKTNAPIQDQTSIPATSQDGCLEEAAFRELMSTSNLRIPALKEIRCVEGDLNTLPIYLWTLLQVGCALTRTKTPACVSRRWSSSVTLSSYEDRKTYFTVANTDMPVKASRFLYGPQQQFIVVTPESDSAFNGGKSAIIVSENKICNVKQDDRGRTRTRWSIWTVFKGWEAGMVDRVIEPATADKSAKIRNTPRANGENEEAVAQPGAMSQSEISSKTGSHQLHSHTTGMQVRKVAHKPGGLSRSRLASKSSEFSLPQSKNNNQGKTTRMWSPDSSDSGWSPERKRSQRLAVPNETEPLPNDIVNEQPFSHEQTAAILLNHDQSVRTTLAVQFRSQPIDRLNTCDNLKNVLFVFKKNESDRHPRVRLYDQCDTAIKLSCQAIANGIGPEIAPAFLLSCEEMEPCVIMRDDKADFEEFILMMACHYAGRQVEVIVLPVFTT